MKPATLIENDGDYSTFLAAILRKMGKRNVNSCLTSMPWKHIVFVNGYVAHVLKANVIIFLHV